MITLTLTYTEGERTRKRMSKEGKREIERGWGGKGRRRENVCAVVCATKGRKVWYDSRLRVHARKSKVLIIIRNKYRPIVCYLPSSLRKR